MSVIKINVCENGVIAPNRYCTGSKSVKKKKKIIFECGEEE